MLQLYDPHDIFALCRSCAEAIGGCPASDYAERVARLLFGTAAHESGEFLYNRQRGFPWADLRGAFGLWQVELGSILDSMDYLDEHGAVARAAGAWLFRNSNAAPQWYKVHSQHSLTQMISGWERAGCLFARLHYLRVPEPISDTAEMQAAYWKRYYNTKSGKGTVEGYLKHWANVKGYCQ